MSIFDQDHHQAILVLADGRVFQGRAVGKIGSTVGELIFNTAMSGYQEAISDPSYAGQLLCFSNPHIGNVGVTLADQESRGVYLSGLVISCFEIYHNHWRAESSLSEYLNKHQVVGICDIDTRQLCRHLRDKGAQNACIMSGRVDIEEALQQAKSCRSLVGQDLASQVTTSNTYKWHEGSDPLVMRSEMSVSGKKHIVVVDFGVKQSILRLLVDRGCAVTVVPANSTWESILALNPNGVLLSNGPGDPAANKSYIALAADLIHAKIPIFGLCFGCQLLALSVGGQTVKMKFGHHGANHPVMDLRDQRVFISSQNHGFMVDEETLPDTLQVTHRSLFDKSIQGIANHDSSIMGFQGHPESAPGPDDLAQIFDEFIQHAT